MVRVGIAGIGFMGMIHYLSYAKVRGAKVVAMADCDRKKLSGDWRSIKGNFGPRGKRMDLKGVRTYDRTDELLRDPDVDLVDVCLPPALHRDVTIAALRAGKHVFCEKPIALDARDAQRMVAAAERAGRQLCVGHVLPYFPEYAYIRELADSRKFGRLVGGSFKRVVSNPLWIANYFDADAIGGPMYDLHIHDAHFIRLMFGMPNRVFAAGRLQGDVAKYFTSQFLYDGKRPVAVTATSGVIDQQGRSFTQGFEIHFEQATVLFDFAVIRDKPVVLSPLTVLDAAGKATQPRLGSSDPLRAFEGELKDVARAARDNRPAEMLDGTLARDAVVLCRKQLQSLQSGRVVKV